MVLPNSPIKICGKSVKRFMSYNKTEITTLCIDSIPRRYCIDKREEYTLYNKLSREIREIVRFSFLDIHLVWFGLVELGWVGFMLGWVGLDIEFFC